MPRPEAATVKLDPYSALAGAGVVNVTVFAPSSTVWLTEPDPLVWLGSPANVAVTVSLPAANAVVVQVATPG